MADTVPAEALQESEELHRITLLNMSDAVFITNDDGLFTFICPNVDVIFGHSLDEVRAMGRISGLLGRELIEPGNWVTTANCETSNTKSKPREAYLVSCSSTSSAWRSKGERSCTSAATSRNARNPSGTA